MSTDEFVRDMKKLFGWVNRKRKSGRVEKLVDGLRRNFINDETQVKKETVEGILTSAIRKETRKETL